MKWCILKYITTTTTVARASIGAHTERTLTENYFFKRNKIILFLLTAISTLLISNCNSFQVLFDNIASVFYFIWKIYLYSSIGNGQPREPALCELYRHTFVPYSSPSLQLFDPSRAGLAKVGYLGFRFLKFKKLKSGKVQKLEFLTFYIFTTFPRKIASLSCFSS